MPKVSDYGFSSGLEDLGFSRTHRRDGSIDDSNLNNTFSTNIDSQTTQTVQEFPENSIPDGKIDTLSVTKLIAGTITSQAIQLDVIDGEGDVFISAGKTDFGDTTNGFIMGIDDSDSNKVKWSIGDASSGADWNVTTANTMTITNATISGTLIAGQIHIPDQDTTANSFHVDTTGAGWVGATTTNRATAPMKWTAGGDLTCSSLSVTGGDTGGWDITTGYIYSLASGTPTSSPTDGLVLASGNPAVICYEDGNKRAEFGYLSSGVYGIKGYDGTGANTIFELSDTQQTIAGWSFDNTKLSSGSVSIDGSTEQMLFGLATAPLTGAGIFLGKDGSDYEFRAGDPASGYIHYDGTSFFINQPILTNLASGSEVAIQEWTYSGAFSVTDLDTVAWASGTLTLMNGQTFAITGANTGNMSAFTYIYLDIAVSTTAFQVSTSFTSGTGKILIATAQNGTTEASYLLMGGNGDYNIDGGSIAASSIIANKLSVSQLSAITADLGTITAGTITGATIQTASANPKFIMTSNSFQGINSTGTTIFEVILTGTDVGDVIMGDDATEYFAKWDNSEGQFISSAKTTVVQEFTAGWDITQGEVVAIESDGKVYPSRVTDIDAIADTENRTQDVGSTVTRMIRVTDTVCIQVMVALGGASYVAQRIVYDADSQTVTSYPNFSAITATGTALGDLCNLGATDALFSSSNGTNTYLQVLDDLATTIDDNAETTVADAIKSVLERYDDTHAVMVYEEDSTGDLKARFVTVSGVVVSVGAEESVYTATTTAEPRRVVRYGDTDYYAVLFRDNSKDYVLTFSCSSSGVFSFGSEVEVDTSLLDDLVAIDDTRVGRAYVASLKLYAQIISRSGTTTTENVAVEISATASGGCLTSPLGEDSFAVAYEGVSGANNRYDLALVRVDDTTPSLLGSVLTGINGTVAYEQAVIKVAPDLLCVNGAKTSGGNYINTTQLISLENNYDEVIGISAEAITASADGDIVLSAYCDDVTGLTTATTYYAGVDGALEEIDQNGKTKVGIALSTTTLKITV